jgi:hypothetical protein
MPLAFSGLKSERSKKPAGSKQSRALRFLHRAPINPEPFSDLPPLFLPFIFQSHPCGVCLLSASCFFLTWLTLKLLTWRRHGLPKRWLSFNEIHDVISQKTELFMSTATRSSNRTRPKWSRYNSRIVLSTALSAHLASRNLQLIA